MLLTLITNHAATAQMAELAGIDRIMIDLERTGKAERQAGRDLFLSDHTWDDVSQMAGLLSHAQVHVRINPWSPDSTGEVDEAIVRGANVVMLPMVHDINHAHRFVDAVQGRARTSLLVETFAALQQADQLTAMAGLDEIHLGLNDLSIDLNRSVIFEVLVERLLDPMAAASHHAGILFGFGGVTSSSAKSLPIDPERILAEQARLQSDVGILGRSFRRLCDGKTPEQIAKEVRWIRETLAQWTQATIEDYKKNLVALSNEITAWKKQLGKVPAN